MKNKKKLTDGQKVAIALIINAFVVLSVIEAAFIGFVCFLNSELPEYRKMKFADFIEMYEDDERENRSEYKEDKNRYTFHRSTEAIAQLKSMNFIQEFHFFNYYDESFETKLYLSSSQRNSSMTLYLSTSFDRAYIYCSGGDLLSAYSFRKYYKVNKEDGMKLADIVKACKYDVTEWEEKPYEYSDDRYFYEKGIE